MSLSEAQIRQLEKRAKGFRRLIASLNDLSMYGIHEHLDKILFVKIDDLKEHLKKKIKRTIFYVQFISTRNKLESLL